MTDAKPKSLVTAIDEFGDYFYETRIERLEYVEKTVRGFSPETLRESARIAAEYEQEQK
jgi:hypothetical protein